MNEGGSIKISWFGKHFGEEPPLVGNKGAGTIFFTGCNLKCIYCQNYQISRQGVGKKYGTDEFVKIMLKLQDDGALNVDLVSPTIWTEKIIPAIKAAKIAGLKIPIVWNSNAYEEASAIKKLDGLVDIYLPDFKYGDNDLAMRYSGVKNYAQKADNVIGEMFRQVGNLELDENGIAKKGIIVRHLILPGHMENSFKVLKRIKGIDGSIYVSLMSQFESVYEAKGFPEINRRVSKKEFEMVYNYQLSLGLENGWVQEEGSEKFLLPDFTKENPFM